MLRLWPERLCAGVFPDRGWVHRRGAQEALASFDSAETASQLIAGLDTLLGERTWPRKGRIELLVSDQFARLVHLPWQDGLTSDAQRLAYGRACFEKAGLGLEGEWLIHARYRHFACSGIAYALPRDLVIQVRDRLAAHGLSLASILPLSGVAYWRHGSGLGRTRNLLLLEESRRVSALEFDGNKYVGMHVQPCGAASADAVRRLLNTVDAMFPGVKRVQYWSADDKQGRQEMIKERLPEATVDILQTSCWQ